MPWTNGLDNMFQKPRSLPNEPQHAGSTKNHVLVTSFASQFAYTQLFEKCSKKHVVYSGLQASVQILVPSEVRAHWKSHWLSLCNWLFLWLASHGPRFAQPHTHLEWSYFEECFTCHCWLFWKMKCAIVSWWEAGPTDGNTLVRGTQTNVKFTWWFLCSLMVPCNFGCWGFCMAQAAPLRPFFIRCVLNLQLVRQCFGRRSSGDVTGQKGLPCSELADVHPMLHISFGIVIQARKSVENHVAPLRSSVRSTPPSPPLQSGARHHCGDGNRT